MPYTPAPRKPARKKGFEVPLWAWFAVGGVTLATMLGVTVVIALSNSKAVADAKKNQKKSDRPPLQQHGFAPERPKPLNMTGPKSSSTEDIVEFVEYGVVKVEISDEWNNRVSLGSGFIVDKSGLVVTNYHVTDSAIKADCLFNDGSRFGVEGYMALAPESDLVVLKLNGTPPNMQVLELNIEEPRKASTVFALGHPHNHEFQVTSGIVSRVVLSSQLPEDSQAFLKHQLGDKVDNTWVSHDAQISGGNSGGPLINAQGQVIGVNSWGNTETHINYAVAAKHLKNLLDHQFPSPQPLKDHRRPQPTVAELVGADLTVSAEKIKELAEKLAGKDWLPKSKKDWEAMSDLMLQVALAKHAAADSGSKKKGQKKPDDPKKPGDKQGDDADNDDTDKEDADKEEAEGDEAENKDESAYADDEPEADDEADDEKPEDEGDKKDEGDRDEGSDKEEGRDKGDDKKESPDIDAAALQEADAVLKTLAEFAWDPEKHVKEINEWADKQVHTPLKGVLLFGTVKKFFEGAEGRNGVLLQLAGSETTIFVPVEKKDESKFNEGHQLMVVAMTYGAILRHGENPLDPEESPVVASDVFIDVKF